MPRHHRLLLPLSLCLSLVGCASDMGADLDGAEISDGDDQNLNDALVERVIRNGIMRSVHEDFLDAAVHDQENEMVVSHYSHLGGWAWVSASVQAKGGGELDWSNSIYAEDVLEGFFDGPRLESLLRYDKDDNRWNVVTADVGSTDVWFDGIWLRRSLPCAILPILGDQCLSVSGVSAGTDERRAIMAAIHSDFLDNAVHEQPNELLVSTARAGGAYAFVTASVQAIGGGDIDWLDSEYADDVEDGFFDGPHLEVLLRKMDGAWVVIEDDIGATDVSWWGAWNRHDNVPCALFPVDACE